MTQEEKIKEAKRLYETANADQRYVLERLFPELAESEDERIRKELLSWLKGKDGQILPIDKYNAAIAWLEKQGSQDNAEDVDILHRFSFYSYKDEPNVLYLSGLYVNEEYRNKGIGTKILEVADEVAKSLDCHAIRLKTKKNSNAERLYQMHGYNSLATEGKEENWLEKQGEQKPVISDDALREGIAHFGITQYQIDNWLKKYVDIEEKGEQKECFTKRLY